MRPSRGKGHYGVMHPEDIKAEIRKRWGSIEALAKVRGLSGSHLRAALCEPRYSAEQVIAHAIGRSAHHLWPDRYHPDGTPLHPPRRQRRASDLVRTLADDDIARSAKVH